MRAARDGDAVLESMFDSAAEFAPHALKDEEWLALVKDIAARRKMKEGRFLRVHFKTRRTVDLVPLGSIASGLEMVKDGKRKAGWRFVSAGLEGEGIQDGREWPPSMIRKMTKDACPREVKSLHTKRKPLRANPAKIDH